MGRQGHRDQYQAAFHQANADLAQLFQEYDALQLRKEQIEDVLVALEPFLPYADGQIEQEMHQPGPVLTEPRDEESLSEVPEPVFNAQPTGYGVPAPARNDMDPIQRRINSALGLAVA